jgi:hypothetical protein
MLPGGELWMLLWGAPGISARATGAAPTPKPSATKATMIMVFIRMLHQWSGEMSGFPVEVGVADVSDNPRHQH